MDNTTGTVETRREGFLPEVQALRALAVLLVVAFHLWPASITGGFVGVDVFFGISGFLITAHLLREIDARGHIRLAGFWARRIRRLLPAAFLVLAVTLVGTIMVLPTTQWRQTLTEIIASALYVQNWRLALDSVDYFAAENLATPVQHYWSLSAEEQFYLAWPLLLLAAVPLSRLLRGHRHRVTVAIVAAVVVGSLAYSIRIARTEPSFGYFSTFSHAWEFGLGALLAAVNQRRTALFGNRPGWGAAAAWLGFALIIWSGLTYTGETPFPGYTALVPLIGTVLVILAGQSAAIWSPARLAASRPVQFLGDISYSLYLWHWPLIVLVPIAFGAPLRTSGKVAVLVVSIVLAAITKALIEDGFRFAGWFRRSNKRSYGVALATTVVLVAGCLLPIVVVDRRQEQAYQRAVSLSGGTCFGAPAALDPVHCTDSHEVSPELGPEFAADDTVSGWLEKNVDAQYADTNRCRSVGWPVTECRFAPKPADDRFTIALIGDSHARTLITPLILAARANGWDVLLFWQGNCRASLPTFESPQKGENNKGCRAWRQNVVDHVAGRDDIDVVVTTGWTRQYQWLSSPADLDVIARAFGAAWDIWASAGKQVFVIPDVPVHRGETVADCIASAGTEADPCALPLDEAIPRDPADIALDAKLSENIHPLDLTEYFCDEQVCHFVVGGVITTRDSHHLTTTFANSLMSVMVQALQPFAVH